jgi:hypothetical protein
MWPGIVEIAPVLLHYPIQVALAQDQEVVVRPLFWTQKMTFLRTQFFNIPLSKPLALKLSRGQVAQR